MGSRRTTDLGWGGLLVAVGVIILLANFGIFAWSGGLWDRWWPLILIAVGVLLLLNRREESKAQPPPAGTAAPPAAPAEATPAPSPRRTFPTGAVILIGLGIAFIIEDYIGGSSFPALVLIAIGVALVLRDRWGR